MSKKIKQLEMDTLKTTFKGVRDLVVMSVQGLPAQTENTLRLTLRKKNIRLQVVKNSLARRTFGEMGVEAGPVWEGPTMVAWGGSSLSDLSKELETEFKKTGDKYKEMYKFKTAVSDGQPITFEQAKKQPTKAEAIGRVLMLALAPASRLAAQILGPAAMVASQVKSVSEKKEEAAPAAEAAPAPPPA
jgi:large subunit ribosomal protein L10